MRLAAASAALVLAALAAGCASVPPEERAAFCRAVDWHEYGRNDGRLGVPAAERTDLFAECRELGFSPDVDAYREGRAEGLRAYCTLENGYEVGLEGRRYRDVCPPELEIAFLQGYNEGRRERGRSYRARPHFGFSIGIGHYYPHHFSPFHHWWFGRSYDRHDRRVVVDGGASGDSAGEGEGE